MDGLARTEIPAAELKGKIDPLAMRSFFRYAERHKGVVFMSHATAAKVGGDFDGDNFQIMPISKEYRPLTEIRSPNRDWSDLTPLVEQVRREGWGQEVTTPKVKRRLATHVAPERPGDVTGRNRPWLVENHCCWRSVYRYPFFWSARKIICDTLKWFSVCVVVNKS